jgi:hypothetical protein
LGWKSPMRKFRVSAQSLAGCAGIGLVTAYGFAFQTDPATRGFLGLLVVAAVASLNYYFTPPLFTFNIEDPQDWVSPGTFAMTPLILSGISAFILSQPTAARRAL